MFRHSERCSFSSTYMLDAYSPPRFPILDSNRTELLKLLLTCFSETMYNPPMDLSIMPNRWILHLTSSENR